MRKQQRVVCQVDTQGVRHSLGTQYATFRHLQCVCGGTEGPFGRVVQRGNICAARCIYRRL
jgi:hypothetical protein